MAIIPTWCRLLVVSLDSFPFLSGDITLARVRISRSPLQFDVIRFSLKECERDVMSTVSRPGALSVGLPCPHLLFLFYWLNLDSVVTQFQPGQPCPGVWWNNVKRSECLKPVQSHCPSDLDHSLQNCYEKKIASTFLASLYFKVTLLLQFSIAPRNTFKYIPFKESYKNIF